MRRAAVLCIAFVALAAAPAASSSVRTLADKPPGGGGPAFAGEHVVYVEESRRGLLVLAQPAVGGSVAEVERLRWPPFSAGWELAAAPDALALRVLPRREPQLWAGPLAGPLERVQGPVRGGTRMASEEDLFAVPGGPLVLERTDPQGRRLRAVLRPPGAPARVLDLPAGADLHGLAVSGGLAAVPVRRTREIVLLELPSGNVRARVPLGAFARTTLIDLAVSAGGDVALTVEDGSGADFVGWAPARTGPPRIVARGDGFGEVRTEGGRIAMVAPVGHSLVAGRVVVFDPAVAEATQLFRGPPASHVDSIAFNGTHVAWSTGGCQLVAPAEPTASTDRVPAGHCVRTEVAFTTFSRDRPLGRRGTLPIKARCLTAPGSSCRIELVSFLKRPVGRLTARVPLGKARTLRIPLSRRAAARVRRDRSAPLLTYATLRDPDGRAHQRLVGIGT